MDQHEHSSELVAKTARQNRHSQASVEIMAEVGILVILCLVSVLLWRIDDSLDKITEFLNRWETAITSASKPSSTFSKASK